MFLLFLESSPWSYIFSQRSLEKELEAGDEIEKNIEALSDKKCSLEAKLEERKQEMGAILMAHDNQLKQMKEVFEMWSY